MNELPLCVRRIGIGVFIVKSQRRFRDEWHTVSLNEPDFPHGQCSCYHFWYRIEPDLVRHLPPEYGYECLHIVRVKAELDSARELCALAEIEFNEAIIPPPDQDITAEVLR